ncbi:MAG: glycosyltransferase family 2 protein [Verrucomicrobiota bacterium]
MNSKCLNPIHCVIIPSYNSGPLLQETVEAVLKVWQPVIVVVDGSNDGSEAEVKRMATEEPQLHVLVLRENQGKGGAVFAAMELALQNEWTHAAVFDSDGQHEVSDIKRFIDASKRYPDAMILGVPIFGEEAPKLRVLGRLVGNWWTHLETLWGGVEDSLFGFRVYPIARSLKVMKGTLGGRRFDFDTQLAVRLYWDGSQPLNLPTRVHYRSRESGGVSHFRYLRDNLLLTLVHSALVIQAFLRLPRLIRFRQRQKIQFP